MADSIYQIRLTAGNRALLRRTLQRIPLDVVRGASRGAADGPVAVDAFATPAQIDALRREGLDVRVGVDVAATLPARRRLVSEARRFRGAGEVPRGLGAAERASDHYLTAEEIDRGVAALAQAFGALCQVVDLPNATHEGRTTRALRLGKHRDG